MYRIGIDLGGTNIAAGVVDDTNCTIIAKESIPTGAKRHYSEIIADMAKVSLKAVKSAGLDIKDIASIGIGSPGTVDNENGILIYANNINFYNVPMREEMQKHINLPVFMDNDANVAAYGEYIACNENVPYFVAITLGTGVGGGVILNNKIFSGMNCGGAELGHITLVKDGEACSCGRKGCWEAYASVTALIRQTKAAIEKHPESKMNELIGGDISKVGGKTAFIAAKSGDAAGQEVVDNYISNVAEGIVDIINIFQPNILIIGGGISKEGDYLLNPIKKIVEEARYTKYSKALPQTELRIAKLGNDAGIVGAALLALQNN